MGSGPTPRKSIPARSRKRDLGMFSAVQQPYKGGGEGVGTGAWGNNMKSSVRLAGVAIAILALAGCSEGQPQQAKSPPPPAVTVAKPVRKLVVDQDEYVGRFVAVASVEVRARVGGYLERINFTDGQMVKESDVLFVIDRRPYRHVLEQAKANLAQARANLAYAQADLDRGGQLMKDHTITQQTYDQRLQTKNVAEAAVKAQEEAVATAELDHEFTELRAPIAGRIGDRRVSIGNLVIGGLTGTPTLLATIVTVDPIRFEFTFDEAAYLRYERLAREGKDVTSREGSVIVAVKLIDEKDFVHQGRMEFVDNVIDKASGTIRGRAVFANPDGV